MVNASKDDGQLMVERKRHELHPWVLEKNVCIKKRFQIQTMIDDCKFGSFSLKKIRNKYVLENLCSANGLNRNSIQKRLVINIIKDFYF